MSAEKEEGMAEVERISVDEARGKVTSGGALLVCAYEDEQKCNTIKLEGAISLRGLDSRLAALPKDRAIILYCA
jgi:hypothetical protein